MVLIGLGSKARQGKDFVAKYMKEAVPDIELFSFAVELKKYCRDHHDELEYKWQMANLTKQKPGWKDDAIYGCTPILQWFGTEVMRKQDPDHWVKIIAQRLETEQPKIAIVTDVRFENEAQFIKENEGFLVEVIRVKADGTRFLDAGRDPHHLSEVALDDYLGWDFTIRVKDGDLEALQAKALGVLSNVLTTYANRNVSNSVPDATGNSDTP